jgi:hypothetical protein
MVDGSNSQQDVKRYVSYLIRVVVLTSRRSTDGQLASAKLERVSPMSCQCLWDVRLGHLLLSLACSDVYTDCRILREAHSCPMDGRS